MECGTVKKKRRGLLGILKRIRSNWLDGNMGDEGEWGKLKEKMPEGWKWRCQPASKECAKGRAKEGIESGVGGDRH